MAKLSKPDKDKSLLPAKVSTGAPPVLTKRQLEISSQRRKGIPMQAIMTYHDMAPYELETEFEAIKGYNEHVVSNFDSNSHIIDATDTVREAIFSIHHNSKKLNSPMEKIRAAKDIISMTEKLVKIYLDLGLIQRDREPGQRTDIVLNVLNQYHASDAQETITRIVDTTLVSELEEPEPLPIDAEILSEDEDI